MKIAKKIAEELTPMLPGHEAFPPRKELVEQCRKREEEIITTHLAPIWEAIQEHIDGDCGDTAGLRAALALMEEE